MNDGSIHKTSTGKVFRCFDRDGNPVNYADHKHIFGKSYISLLEVGQQLKQSSSGITLKRIK